MSDVLNRDLVVMRGTSRTHHDAVREAGALLVSSGAVSPGYVDAMLEREATTSTYMGNFLAIPHGTLEAKEQIRRSAVSLVRYDEPLDWNGQPVHVVVGIAGEGDSHLEILGQIALVFSDDEQVSRVLSAANADEILAVFAANDGS